MRLYARLFKIALEVVEKRNTTVFAPFGGLWKANPHGMRRFRERPKIEDVWLGVGLVLAL